MSHFDCKKDLFDIPEGVTYLNAATMSPLLKTSAAAAEKAIARKVHPWSIGVEDFFTDANRSCAMMADMIGAGAKDVCIIPSVSYGIAIAARNIPVKKGQKIILLADQFPSNVYAWQEKAKKVKAQIITIERPEDDDWTRAIIAAIDQDTAMVCCAQSHWTDGGFVDLIRLGQKCRAAGAALVLDLTQSLGVFPFCVKEVDPDFMICGTYKWMLGPYSYGFAYIAPRWQDGSPLEENWIARKGSEDFSRLADYQDDYQPGARRFDMGERSNFFLTPVILDAMENMKEWGAAAISQYLGSLTDFAAAEAQKLGIGVAEKQFRSPHLLGLIFDNGVPEGLAQKLASEQVYVSIRGNAIRVSPHVYNDEKDIERFFTILKKYL